MSNENKTLVPVWIVYVDGKRLDTKHEGALKKIVVRQIEWSWYFFIAV